MTTRIKYALLDENAHEPTVKYAGDAGIDVYALKDYIIAPHYSLPVETGVAFNIPDGYVMQAWPKSRNDFLVGAGIIDNTYQGAVIIKVVNFREKPMIIRAGDPIAQLVIVANIAPRLEEEIPSMLFEETSERGDTGGIVTQTRSWVDPANTDKSKFGLGWD